MNKLSRPLILASSSPRRQYLMKEVGFDFTVEKPDVEESFPDNMPVEQVPRYLAQKKAEHFRLRIQNEIVVTADTVVVLGGKILNKPADHEEACSMLAELSGATHRVITGVCIVSKEKEETFDETTNVTFRVLTKEDIDFYVTHYKPFDKAGAYGAQDCLPAGVNPCSTEEMDFLTAIGKTGLIEKTFTPAQQGAAMVAIEKIGGSYFNVMGLPVHKVYAHLESWP